MGQRESIKFNKEITHLSSTHKHTQGIFEFSIAKLKRKKLDEFLKKIPHPCFWFDSWFTDTVILIKTVLFVGAIKFLFIYQVRSVGNYVRVLWNSKEIYVCLHVYCMQFYINFQLPQFKIPCKSTLVVTICNLR